VNATPYAAATDVGQTRENNEDAFLATDTLWVVADGMGGHAGGEIASRLAVDAVAALLQARTVDADALADAFAAAHESVRAAAQDDDLAGMGTTLVLALSQHRQGGAAGQRRGQQGVLAERRRPAPNHDG